MAKRHVLTDSQWESIKDLLPGKQGDLGRTAGDNRLFVEAVLYVLTASQRGDAPQASLRQGALQTP